MNIPQLHAFLKQKLRHTNFKINRPWELLKLKYLKHLEVTNGEIKFIILEQGREWQIRIEERGNDKKSELFQTEKEACTYFQELFQSRE